MKRLDAFKRKRGELLRGKRAKKVQKKSIFAQKMTLFYWRGNGCGSQLSVDISAGNISVGHRRDGSSRFLARSDYLKG